MAKKSVVVNTDAVSTEPETDEPDLTAALEVDVGPGHEEPAFKIETQIEDAPEVDSPVDEAKLDARTLLEVEAGRKALEKYRRPGG